MDYHAVIGTAAQMEAVRQKYHHEDSCDNSGNYPSENIEGDNEMLITMVRCAEGYILQKISSMQWKSCRNILRNTLWQRCTRLRISNTSVQNMIKLPKMSGKSSIGKREYNYWKNLIGYEIVSNEGKTFKTTLKEIQSLLDNDVPTILFGLDMYHLPYQRKFYHECHIPGHIVLMVGYDEKNVYVHDNSKIGVQTVPVDDLRLAWANDYIGISKRNAYFGIDMKSPNHDISHIIQQGISCNANLYLNAPLGFIGQKGISKFIKEFPSWEKTFRKKN